MTQRPFRIYLAIFMLITFAYFMSAVITNWLVDPFDEFGRNKIGLYFSTERQAVNGIVNSDHDAILLGSSRVAAIPSEKADCYKFYNAAFANASTEEEYFFLKKYLTSEKMVVIGLDFFIFNERQFAIAEINEWPDHFFGRLEYLTSFNALKSSIIALYKWHAGQKPRVLKDNWITIEKGLLSPQNETKKKLSMANGEWQTLEEKERRSPAGSESTQGKKDGQKALSDPYYNEGSTALYSTLEGNHYRRFHLSEKRLEYLKKIKVLLDDKRTNYVVFINPESEATHFLTDKTGNHETFINWVKEVKKIFPDVKDLSDGEFSAKENYYPSDGFHYKPEVGLKILNFLLKCNDQTAKNRHSRSS
jgi:hypothetical protein